ncbi:MAG: hypothetical protein GQ574_13055 [Crocinitomix sp.]|nr:hypothetical protein [Crocinitomix sp.]
MTKNRKKQFNNSSADGDLLINLREMRETISNVKNALKAYGRTAIIRPHIYDYQRECETITQGLETIQNQLKDLITRSKEWESI